MDTERALLHDTFGVGSAGGSSLLLSVLLVEGRVLVGGHGTTGCRLDVGILPVDDVRGIGLWPAPPS